MRRRGRLPLRLVLRDQRVDHARVFAVNARDTAVFFQLQQRGKQVLIADHHGGIRHVHLERWDTGGKHGRNFIFDALVPVVNGHVEAIVAAGPAVGLFVPEIKPVTQRLALIRAGEVDDHRCAAVDGAARAGVKVVGGRGVADVEVKMRMRVDKAGEEQLAAHVDDLCAIHCQSFADSSDLLAVHQHIRNAGACRRDDRAALEQRFHDQIILSCIGVYVSKISARRSSRSPPGRCRKACRILQS